MSENPKHQASCEGHAEVVRVLLNHGADAALLIGIVQLCYIGSQ